MKKENPKIIMMSVDEIKPYENNPRVNDKAVEYVANSIKDFGFKVPIVVDKDMVIINGHTRLKASQKLGLKEVPVIIADDLSEEKVRAFRLADNKSSEIATWDYEMLEEELSIIGLDMAEYGFIDFSDEAQSLIDDLMENEFAVRDTGRDEFSVSFVFDKKYQDLIKAYISNRGKDGVVEDIIKLAKGEK